MKDASLLLTDLQRLLKELEDDLRERCEEVAEVGAQLRSEYDKAKKTQRTAQAFEVWREDYLTQVGVAWILGCVFVRFMEDNDLIGPSRLAGPGERLAMARDQHTLFFRQHPRETDRDYLLDVFEQVTRLPGAASLFDKRHNPIWELAPSGDGAARLLEFWRQIEPETGALRHDFTDLDWNTRFLGDLYQDLSESARKKYALLQTPGFVEEFILDRTLTPAIDEFGYGQIRMIDPACGSGHFLLGGFDRLFKLHVRHEPATNPRELAQRTLNQLYGVDLNPFAVAIARFRLLVVALKACDIHRLADAPGFTINLAAGDSLLHGPRPGRIDGRTEFLAGMEEADPLRHVYHSEDKEELQRILGQQYHVVVGNPPYITPKDAALNKAYRERFGSCHMKYSLAVPFKERMFDLAIAPENGQAAPAGYVGMITADSFMKREFGKKVIEQYLARLDLTHVISTSGAYIPGHGTPTVILFGRHRWPVGATIRAVMGIKGEPATPDDPSKGLVWTAITEQIDRPGSQSAFISVNDTPREQFAKHPWSTGGGGAAELKEQLEGAAPGKLVDLVDSIGITSFTLEDDVFLLPPEAARRHSIPSLTLRPMIVGDIVRDWTRGACDTAVFPYTPEFEPIEDQSTHPALRYLWLARTGLSNNMMFGGKTKVECGLHWYEYGRLTSDKLRTPLSIVFAFVATHNHFVLDRGGRVFKQSAPVIKLPATATEDDHLALLGLLNSSTACFWLKQMAHNKGSTVDDQGARQRTTPFEDFWEFTSTQLQAFPLPTDRPLSLAQQLDVFARRLAAFTPNVVVRTAVPSTQMLAERHGQFDASRARMISLQEELDWTCYQLYGLVDDAPCSENPPPLGLGLRAFEIILARQAAAGGEETTWFDRHGSTPITEIPAEWPEEYKRIVQRRIEIIESDRNIGLIERPEYKRRWNTEPWEEQQERALRNWLLDRLESYFDFDGRMSGQQDRKADGRSLITAGSLTTVAKVADLARADQDFMQVAELYRGNPDFGVAELVAELVAGDSVPFLPVLRYKDTGLRKRGMWEQVWGLQRAEDAIDERTRLPEGHAQRLTAVEAQQLKAQQVGEIPVPPKYTSADFAASNWWRLRGKLDVPKERWVSYPHCSRDADPSLVIGWAGWDHLQQAQALAAYYVDMKENEGWSAERLTPLLAGLLELLPWVKQWHNELNPDVNMGLGDYYQSFVDEEARSLGLTTEAIRGWKPVVKGRGGARSRASRR